jgi:hypothetical protein
MYNQKSKIENNKKSKMYKKMYKFWVILKSKIKEKLEFKEKKSYVKISGLNFEENSFAFSKL